VPGAEVIISTANPARMKIASVAYSSMEMSIGLRCAVLMCAALCFSSGRRAR